ncbi:MAG: hypothetical protein IMF08_14385 [Proteobacteria bacterium]|nr:hypothetical protein [Pseudomonadota bacterium]
MTRTLTQFIDPITTCESGGRSLVKCAVRAVQRRLASIGGTTDRERKDFRIKQDLAHLDRNQLRDIGIDRGAL